MKKTVVLIALSLFMLAVLTSSIEAKPRKGIQQNLPVYQQYGVLCAEQVQGIQNAINEELFQECILPAGLIGDNYWVDQDGSCKVKRGYVIPQPGRKARKIAGFYFFITCDNLFASRCEEMPDRPLQPYPPPQEIQLNHNLKVAPLEVNVTSQENINLKVEPIKADIKVEAVIKDERPPAPICVTVINQAPATIPYYGAGGMQSGVSTTTYQIGGLQQYQLYPQPQPINIGPITATGGTGGNASATGGNAQANGGNASASASAAASSQ